MAIVRRRVLALSEHDMRKQTWMIRASLGTLAPGIDRPPAMTHQLDDGNGGELRQRLLNTARSIADHPQLPAPSMAKKTPPGSGLSRWASSTGRSRRWAMISIMGRPALRCIWLTPVAC